MDSWHCHQATDLLGPLEVQRFWSTDSWGSAGSPHTLTWKSTRWGWCSIHGAMSILAVTCVTHVALSRDRCGSSRGCSAHPAGLPRAPQTQSSPHRAATLNVTWPLWKPWPWTPRKAVEKHVNKLGFCHFTSMGCVFCLKASLPAAHGRVPARS